MIILKYGNKFKNILIGAVIISALILLFTQFRITSFEKFNKIVNTTAKVEDKFEILVDVEESVLYLFNNGQIEKKYSCSGGKWSTPSPIGTWKIIQKARWGEGFRWALDGAKCSLGKIWNTRNIRPIFCGVVKLTWVY